MQRRQLLQGAAAVAALPLLPARAQERVVRVVVGFPPGGSLDTAARVLLPHLQSALGQTVVIESKPGAGGRIALEYVKAAKPDGQTLLLSPASMFTLYPSTFRELRYDPVKDFTPVAAIIEVVSCIFCAPNVPARTVAEYVAWVKKELGPRASFGTPADGSMPHFLGMSLMEASGLPMNPIPYRGSAPLVNEVMGGHVPVGVTPLSDVVEHHNAGKLRVLAIGGDSRFAALPHVPTFKELGINVTGGVEWYGFFVPHGTSPSIVSAYEGHVLKTLELPQVRNAYAPKAWRVVPRKGVELARMVHDDQGAWRDVVKRLKYSPQ